MLLAAQLIDWARHHGAWVSDSVEIRQTPYGGRGVYVTTDIEADTELVRLPSHLQLGVTQLAEGDDVELQSLARCLPPTELRFLPCAVALCSEIRKGDSSTFKSFIKELPVAFSNAIAPGDGFGIDPSDDRYDEPSGLTWEPIMAAEVASMRRALRALHESLAPRSLPFRDLCWASAIVCSRSLTRKRVHALTGEELGRVGEYAGMDRTRLLPVIDLVNHAIPLGDANADVRHVNVFAQREIKTGLPFDRFSTSLISVREIRAGGEVLLNYGAGVYRGPLPDQKVLLDFGFVLPLRPDYTATLRLASLLPPSTVSTDEAKYLRILVNNMRRSVEPGPLRFSVNGEPSVATLALALASSFRGPEDLARLVQTVESAPETLPDTQLLEQIVEGSTAAQMEHALDVLATAAKTALAQIQSTDEPPCVEVASRSLEPDNRASFDSVAQDYRAIVCDMLQCVAEHPKHC
jgi:hypothetical protein